MTTLTQLSVPTKSEVSKENQAIFENLEKNIGFVPNLYAYYAKNDTALKDYLALQNRKSTLRAKEKEVVNLVVSEFNGCKYCLSTHTTIGKMNGLGEDQILEIRTGNASFDSKLDALAKFTLESVTTKGKVSEKGKTALFNAGYNEANMIDIVLLIGDKMISNFIHNLAQFEIDFPLAEKI